MMALISELFSLHGIFTLGMLILLQAVLGFDNLLYISIESKRVEESKQQSVRRLGIGLAILLRIVLLFCVKGLITTFEAPFFSLGSVTEGSWIVCSLNLESVVVLFGGAFILYTAVREIWHMVSAHDIEHDGDESKRTYGAAVFWIVLMNLIFSFDSILAAMAITDNMFIITIAIIFSGILMIVLADNVAEFLKKNRMYEVLGLFILFIVGVMLVSEGGHKAHFAFWGHPVEAMQKSTFYFVIAVLVIVDVVQSRYQKKLLAMREHELKKRQQADAAS